MSSSFQQLPANWNSTHGAYLILRTQVKTLSVSRLDPDGITTIGRAPTNQIVIPDDICSRNHCEVFIAHGEWTLRDLDSRNGTLLAGRPVTADSPLEDGDEIQIGDYFLIFSQEVNDEFGEGDPAQNGAGTDTYFAAQTGQGASEPEILYRSGVTAYHSPDQEDASQRSEGLARLYRLALDMGAATEGPELSDLVLAALFESVGVDIGAILLLPRAGGRPDLTGTLRVAVYRSSSDESYEQVSSSVSRLVLDSREGILARDIKDDARLTDQASLNQMQARSVICVPIRTADAIYGVIHLYTTHGGRRLGVEALEYSLAVADQYAIALENLTQRTRLIEGLNQAKDEAEELRSQLEIETDIVGDSAAIDELKDSIARAAPTDATVLIRGESGVGKELVARSIHFNSERKRGPFVCMNCAALSESLLESELFGHEKGAFTGATGRKLGKFEQANGGTLFLDEVGEMSPTVQAKFLRVLEGHPFERVGGGTEIKVNVRVVAATNRDLEKAIEENRFRKDLFFRLFVIDISVPPLRAHSSDIPVLAEYFLQKFAARCGNRVEGFSRTALEKLSHYDWPGNVRELQNTIERAVILSRGPVVEPNEIHLSTLSGSARDSEPEINDEGASSDDSEIREISLEELEKEHILGMLERTSWNKSLAAQILGIERSTLDRKLKRYNVSRPKRSSRRR
ncbi:MAG: sigma 54-interacting transcriptional regulator [Planctomycetota bacterium]|jgi:Nif-specific regulatory protein